MSLTRGGWQASSSLKDHFPYSHDQINRSIVFLCIEFGCFGFELRGETFFLVFCFLFWNISVYIVHWMLVSIFVFKKFEMAKEANKTGKEIKTKNPLDFIWARLNIFFQAASFTGRVYQQK